MAGWWFGCHFLFSHSYWVAVIIPIDELIFFRGVAKNHQPDVGLLWINYGRYGDMDLFGGFHFDGISQKNGWLKNCLVNNPMNFSWYMHVYTDESRWLTWRLRQVPCTLVIGDAPRLRWLLRWFQALDFSPMSLSFKRVETTWNIWGFKWI